MKKILLFLCALVLAVFLCGCDNPSSSEPSSSSVPSSSSSGSVSSEETSSSSDSDLLNAIGDIEVEKELFDVTLTIPADFMSGITQEDLDAAVSAGVVHSAVLNDDGSVAYTMSKSQHKELLNEIAVQLNDSLSEMIGSEECPNITDIKASDDFTTFTVTTTSTEITMEESFSVINFYFTGGMYAVFSGEEVDNIHVDFVNAETGEIISSADSKDAAN